MNFRPAKLLFEIFIVILVALAYITIRCQMEKSSEIEVLYKSSGPRVLIIYHPSYIDRFQQELTAAFAEGAAAHGVGVDRITAQKGILTPELLEQYKAIVIGTNTYYWMIDRPSTRALKSLHSLKHKTCYGLITGFGATENATSELNEYFKNLECEEQVVSSFWVMKPNDESRLDEDNKSVAIENARFLGKRLGTDLISIVAKRLESFTTLPQ
jgi:hypothetical protein